MIAGSAEPINKDVRERLTLPMMGMVLRPIAPIPQPSSLPLATSRNGSLFTDRFDSKLHWYLPDFALAVDVDPGFAFAVRQTGQQANGQPFLVVRLSLRLSKQQPAQAAQFAQANSSAVLREIPLENLAAVLSSVYTDQNGNPQQRTFSASSIQDQGDGSCLLVFDGSILGDSVLAVYQDLRAFGKAAITVNGGFQSWSQSSPSPVFYRPVATAPMAAPASSGSTLRSLYRNFYPAPPPPTPPPTLVEVKLPYGETLPLKLKFNSGGYESRYTISTATAANQVILGAGDLSGFSQRQTQFAEFTELGDLSLKYPTLSRAYFGVVSKTIVVVPQRYSIVRSKTGCSATCLARVDSSPSSASQCAFDFTFMIAPEISPIDLAKLTAEIASHSDLSGYQIVLADSLQTKPPSTLLTPFASTVQFAAGADPHTFAVTITVQDSDAKAPAVANANLLILQLSAQSGTDLIGSLSLKLDDGYPDPVLAPIDLSFAHTAGSNEVLAQINEGSKAIEVANHSPLDVQMQNYALIQGANVTEVAAPTLIAAGGSVSFALPANSDGLAFVYEAQLALPASMTASAVTNFLHFETVDVQNMQYVVALDASGISFTKVAAVACTVTFPTLPSIAPWQTTLTANLKADSSHIQIPIENAVFTLPGTINLTVHAVDPTAAPLTLTLQNDFTANPVMVLLQSQLAGAASPAGRLGAREWRRDRRGSGLRKLQPPILGRLAGFAGRRSYIDTGGRAGRLGGRKCGPPAGRLDASEWRRDPRGSGFRKLQSPVLIRPAGFAKRRSHIDTGWRARQLSRRGRGLRELCPSVLIDPTRPRLDASEWPATGST